MPPKCSKCGKYHMGFRCPPPDVVLICAECAKPIRDGEYYYDIGDDQYCVLCGVPKEKLSRAVSRIAEKEAV